MFDLNGKQVVIFGVASEDSIAWGIAKCLAAAGARIALGYQQRFKSRVMRLVRSGEVPIAYWERCDVTVPEEREAFFAKLEPPVDAVVHSIAFADPATFSKRVSEVTGAEFAASLAASSWSLLPLVSACRPKMSRGGSVIALSYLGGSRVVPNYKVMGIAKAALEAAVRELAAELGPEGIRVNAISAGPIRTLAASQIEGFESLLDTYQRVTPLRRLVNQEDVGNLASFLASGLARNITGQTLYVDAGYSILGMGELRTGST